MLGKRSAQRGLFEADHLYLDYVGRDTFYGFTDTDLHVSGQSAGQALSGRGLCRAVLPGQRASECPSQPSGHCLALADPRPRFRCRGQETGGL